MTSSSYDLAVAGGGAIGLACAWRAAQRGLRTVVVDAGEPGAWEVAAGMLAPVAESDFGDAPLTELGLRAARAFEGFCAELAESGVDPGYRATGTLVVARDRDEAEALDRMLAFRRELGLEVERLLPSAARRAEPALAPTVRLALDIPGDHSVDPRRLVAALAAAFERAGGTLRQARVSALVTDGDRAAGLRLADGEEIAADRVLLAPGTGEIDVPEPARVPVRPVKGQIMRLRDPRGPPPRRAHDPRRGRLPRPARRRRLRARRDDGGARPRHRADRRRRLRAAARRERDRPRRARARDRRAAGRAPSRDPGQPAGDRPGALEGLVWAAGHFRNGILLAPVTADLAVAAVCDEPLPDWAAPADPRRFSGVAV